MDNFPLTRESVLFCDHKEHSADFDHFSLLIQVCGSNAQSLGRHKSDLGRALALQGMFSETNHLSAPSLVKDSSVHSS